MYLTNKHRVHCILNDTYPILTKVKMDPKQISHVKTKPNPGDRPFSIEPKAHVRGQWATKMEFILAVAGHIVGLGNVWRFPYLCYKNGGGVFFIPYVLFLFTCGIPLFFLETSLGQFTSQGGITCWRNMCPLFEGLGYGSQVVVLYTGVYYIVILAWTFLYLFSSFRTELPWVSCNNSWNTVACFEHGHNDTPSFHLYANTTSSVVQFWERRILGLSDGIDNIGSVRWDLALCLLLAWVLCYFCVWNGVKSTGKVVYFTATFPYVMLAVLLVRGLTLPGAKDGILFYLYPDPSRLADPEFVYQESLVTTISDMYPFFFQKSLLRRLLLLTVCAGGFLVGLVMVTEGGLYVFQLFDYYACSGMTLLFFAILQSVCIGWVYGADRHYDNVKDMIGYRPWPFMKYCWRYITPAICTFTFLFSVIKHKPLKFNNTYEYPWWGYALGLFFTLSSTLLVPLWMLYAVSITPGTLTQRLKHLCTPAKNVPAGTIKKASNLEAFQSFTDFSTLRPANHPQETENTILRSSVV
uniref:Transporter n=1 Tax=Poecilia reticulata TaxID=8081 RepID=A0A3P9N2S3_POERE